MSNTMSDDFKFALYSVKDTFTKEDEKKYTVVQSINEYIKLLLNDDLMMKPKNKFSFSERTLATRHNLVIKLATLLSEDAGKKDGFFEKADIIFKAIDACSVSIRVEERR